MAFGHGASAKVYGNGIDLSVYLASATASKSADVAEVSTMGVASKQYVGGLKDATIAIEGFWDGDADAVDEELDGAIGAVGSVLTHWPQGDALGNRGKAGQAVETSYEITTSVDDAGAIAGEFQTSSGLHAVQSLHPKGSESSDSNGTGVDQTAQSTDGGTGYLHVFSVTGGTGATVKIQDSDDDAVYVDLITFTAVTAGNKGGEAVEVAGTVERYVRAQWALGGGSSEFAVSFARH